MAIKRSELVSIFTKTGALALFNCLSVYAFATNWIVAINLTWFVEFIRIALAVFVIFGLLLIASDYDLQTTDTYQTFQNVLNLYKKHNWFFVLTDTTAWAATFAAAAYGAFFLAVLYVVHMLISWFAETLVKAMVEKRQDLVSVEEF